MFVFLLKPQIQNEFNKQTVTLGPASSKSLLCIREKCCHELRLARLYATGPTTQQVLHATAPDFTVYCCYSLYPFISVSHLPLILSASLLHLWARHSTANYRRVFQVSHASSGNTHIQYSICTQRDTHTHNICLNPQTVVTVGKTCENPSVKSNVFHAYLIP